MAGSGLATALTSLDLTGTSVRSAGVEALALASSALQVSPAALLSRPPERTHFPANLLLKAAPAARESMFQKFRRNIGISKLMKDSPVARQLPLTPPFPPAPAAAGEFLRFDRRRCARGSPIQGFANLKNH